MNNIDEVKEELEKVNRKVKSDNLARSINSRGNFIRKGTKILRRRNQKFIKLDFQKYKKK